MNKTIRDKNLSNVIEVDSAGTIDYHTGETADARMKRSAEKKGYKIDKLRMQE
jgi:protein-tyrosine phosphatase